jgi:cardiolipin synthase
MIAELREASWWLVTLAGLGALAMVTAIITLFWSLGRRPPALRATEAPAPGTDEFLDGLSHLLSAPEESGGTARLLDNGDAFFPVVVEAIRGARSSVHWMAYIWEPGKASDLVFAALTERARAGVEVRVLLDGLGCFRAPSEGIEALKAAGGQVAWFRALRFGKILRFHKRNHRRAIVMDGRLGYTGGMAVGDKWLGNARNPEEWRDSMTEVTGPLAATLQSAFADLWAYVTGEMLMGTRYYPPAEPGAPSPIRHVGVCSSPSSDEHPLRLFYALSFLAARHKLYITTPYFVPDKHTRETVAEQARRGVDVRILLPNHHTDAKPIRAAGHSYFQALLEAGVRIWEYQPTMMHTKSVVVDGVWSVVGSANMDVRSKELNQENVLGILDGGLAGDLEASFLADLARSREITLEAWSHRGLRRRVTERLAEVFAEQY